MRSGRLDTLCSIEEPQATASTFGGPLPPTDAQATGRAVVKMLWASINGLTGRELERAGAKVGEMSHKAEIRWHRNVKQHMVLVRKRDGVRFDIVSAVDPTGARECLNLLLREVPAWTA